MSYYPFFVNVEFEGSDEPSPFTPVKAVELGYLNGSTEFRVDRFDPPDWHKTGEWLRAFHTLGTVVPVGYNLRNLVWPALTANLTRASEPLKGLMMPMEKKWNSLDMVDLAQLLVQGGYSDFKPTLDETCGFFGIQTGSAIEKIHALYQIYQKVGT